MQNCIISTVFNNETWNSHGINWMRKIKSLNYQGMVIDAGISSEAKSKLNEMKFRLVELKDREDQELGEIKSIANSVLDSEICLNCKFDFDFKADFDYYFKNNDQWNLKSDQDSIENAKELCVTLSNLNDRVRYSVLFKDKPVVGGKIICGSKSAWMLYISIYDLMMRHKIIEMTPKSGKFVRNFTSCVAGE